MTKEFRTSISKILRQYGQILSGAVLLTISWILIHDPFFFLGIILGAIMSGYGTLRVVTTSLQMPKGETIGKYNTTLLHETVPKYFHNEEFDNLPGIDITHLRPDGQNPTNKQLGLITAHVLRDYLILVIRTKSVIPEDKFNKLISDINGFSMSEKLNSHHHTILKEDYVLSNYVLTYSHDRRYGLLIDLNYLLYDIRNLITP